MRKSGARLVLGLGVIGLVLSLLGAAEANQRADQARAADVQSTSAAIAEAAADRLGQAIFDTASLERLRESSLLTIDDLEVTWATSFDSFGGDSAVFFLAEVDPAQDDAFAEAMNEIIPGFEITFRPAEALPQRLLIVNGAPDAEAVIGIDMAGQPAFSELLLDLRPDRVSIDGLDSRTAESLPGTMRVIRAHPVVGPEQIERQGWTVTFVDLTAILDPLVAESGDNLGAQVSTSMTGTAGDYGASREGDDLVGTSAVGIADVRNDDDLDVIRDFEVVVTAWSDGSHVPVTSGRTVLLVGLIITGLIMSIAAVWLAVRSLTTRADRSHEVARRDALTGLPNRRWLLEHLADIGTCAVLFCDLDRFKVVNDSEGHNIGDELLVAVAGRLEESVGTDGSIGRYGGDEFLVVCPTETEPGDCGVRIAQRILEAFERPFEISTGTVRMTTAIGIASMGDDGATSVEEVIREADVALGDCKKRRSRGGFVLYDESFRDAEQDRLRLEALLQDALDAGDFEVYYQPIVDVSGASVSFEALVRWRRDGALVLPSVFLPIVAEIQRMDDLGRVVLESALRTFHSAASASDHQRPVKLHVNVDAIQLEDSGFPSTVAELLEASGVDPTQLVLELTEGEWVEASDSTAAVLEELTSLGVGLSIDDFGRGYSSLERILSMPGLDQIKLDASLVGAAADERTAGFLAGLIDGIAHLGVGTVAEGIETHDELQRMRDLGIVNFQGFLFAPPGPPEAVGLGED